MQYYKFIKDMRIYSKHGVIEFIKNELKTENELINILDGIFDKVVLNKNIQKINLPKKSGLFLFWYKKTNY